MTAVFLHNCACLCDDHHILICFSPLPQCVDLSCNELSEITLPENLPPKLQELDLTGNPRLNLDHKTLEQLKYVIVFIVSQIYQMFTLIVI